MTRNLYTVLAVVLCTAAIYCFLVSFSRSVRALIRFVLRACIGVSGLAVFNSVLSVYSISVGINVYTTLLCGLFGLPGYLLLVGTRFLF